MKFTAETDPIVKFMARNNMVYSRQNYLECLFAFDGVPDELEAEVEASLPSDLRKGEPGDWEEIE
jgi:hypothetical protein